MVPFFTRPTFRLVKGHAVNTKSKTLETLVSLVERFNSVTVAVCAGVSPGTVTQIVKYREMPDREHARLAVERCCSVNAAAMTRSELRLV